MDFSIPDDHRAIRDGVAAVVKRFDDEYWLARDEDGEFPREFHRAMADAGWPRRWTRPTAPSSTTTARRAASSALSTTAAATSTSPCTGRKRWPRRTRTPR